MYQLALLLHLLSATIWTGGHIIISITYIPKLLIKSETEGLLNFESKYEKIGMPALFIQIITGLYLAYTKLPDFSLWFSFSNRTSTLITLKILLLSITAIFALVANFVVIPKVKQGKLIKIFAFLVLTVTLSSILFVVVGFAFRGSIF